jgi:hypothetical protein
MGPISCPETSVNNYRTPGNIPEELISKKRIRSLQNRSTKPDESHQMTFGEYWARRKNMDNNSMERDVTGGGGGAK